MIRLSAGFVTLTLLFSTAVTGLAQTLRGSMAAMERQNRIAQDHDFTFLRTGTQVHRFVDLGLLVPLRGNANYELANVSYPVARPAIKLFVERLSAQYRAACGERLVVTSLTRPIARQPSNASEFSVHPVGMAVDFRVSSRAACRNWLERTLMSLEREGVLDAIRERQPPHYHVAVFPLQYSAYVDRMTGSETQVAAVSAPAPSPADGSAAAVAAAAAPRGIESASLETYSVSAGDTLWAIAQRYLTTVDILQELNGLRSTRILPGQALAVPLLGNVE